MSQMPVTGQSAPANLLLRSLSPAALSLLLGQATLFDLRVGESHYQPGSRAEWVIFPSRGLLSILTVLNTGRSVETTIVGRESAVGLIEAVGSGLMSSRVQVQAPGEAWRVPAKAYGEVLAREPAFNRAVQGVTELLVLELRQAVICHTLHDLDGRLARWLLECQDRLDGEEILPLTHEFLAAMLGVQRTTVTERTGVLQASKLIRTGQGAVTILDRDGLEARACECRATVAAARRSRSSNMADVGHASLEPASVLQTAGEGRRETSDRLRPAFRKGARSA